MTVFYPTEFSRLRRQAGFILDELETSLGYSRRTLSRYESSIISPRSLIIDALC